MIFKHIIQKGLIAILLISAVGYSQQDPQYTQYMYNTMSVNPGYAGSLDHLVVNALHRSQWIGLDGAPKTQTLGVHAPLKNNVGLGLSIINDNLGPANETFVDANFSYTIQTSDKNKLAFGLKAGARFFDVDFSKGLSQDPDPLLAQNLNEVFLTIGGGFFYYSEKWYVGLSVPNFMTNEYYDNNATFKPIDKERLHYYLIGGYVFDLNDKVKFKPAVLAKAVSGAPWIADFSANFLFNEKFTAGVAYRWDDSVSALAGFQITENLNIGYAYDHTTTNLRHYSNGTHEFMLRYEFIKKTTIIKSPRFF
ncbi:MAG: type IX secretion system membrane protein PorP/SprF [Flavobacteriaceae bacterium]|nr:type IX secretion system membrane protein PorP/SprF [Flavobacteriaceae bacterium]